MLQTNYLNAIVSSPIMEFLIVISKTKYVSLLSFLTTNNRSNATVINDFVYAEWKKLNLLIKNSNFFESSYDYKITAIKIQILRDYWYWLFSVAIVTILIYK